MRRSVFAAVFIVLLGIEAYAVFVRDDSLLSIEGSPPYDIQPFGQGRAVSHAFLMKGDGLFAASVRFSADRPSTVRVHWRLSRGMADEPESMSVVTERVEEVSLRGGREWKTFEFLRDGSSNDHWFTFDMWLEPPQVMPGVALVASQNNPDRGGVLWVAGERQLGSLMIRAHRRGRTFYRRFLSEAAPNLPPPLRSDRVHLFATLVIHGALAMVLYSLVDTHPARPRRSQPFVLVVAENPADATTTLFFKGLGEHESGSVCLSSPGDPHLAGLMARASALIMVRALFEYPQVVRAAKALGLPRYYFVDDNFITVREVDRSAFLAPYSVEAVREALLDYDGVLFATDPLAEYFRVHGLHQNIGVFPPAYRPPLADAAGESEALTIAFFGGAHLRGMFESAVLPAIRRLAGSRRVRLVTFGVDAAAESPGLEVVGEPYCVSYDEGVSRLMLRRVDILVHPLAPGHPNNQFKNPHALLTAARIGAVAVVSDQPPYDEIARQGAVVAAGPSADDWYQALHRVADAPARTAALSQIREYSAARFDGEVNRLLLTTLLTRHKPPSRLTRPWRSLKASAQLSIGRGLVLLGRARRMLSFGAAG